MSYRDDLAAAHARIAALEDELADTRAAQQPELTALARARQDIADDLEAARRESARLRDEVARLRAECAGYVERIQILQGERTRLLTRDHGGAREPVVLEHGAPPICVHCRRSGHTVSLVRDVELTPAVCPRCTTVTLVR